MDRLGPFEPAPALAVAVSGGPDSLALAMLAQDWARTRGGTCHGLIVDHGLRASSATEAAWTERTLAGRGMNASILTLAGLGSGPRLAERARDTRYQALEAFCANRGIVHLLLGHHAADQAETVAMRMLRGSHADGLSGMGCLVETNYLRLLRPLLAVPPGRLRATLLAAGQVEWIEDPSNRDGLALRARLRSLRRDPDGTGVVTAAACRAATARGRDRARRDAEDAAWLGRHATLYPKGYALLDSLPPEGGPMAALLRVVAGATRPPRPSKLEGWLTSPRPATLHGVVLRPAGRLAAGGWRLIREPAAVKCGVPAHPGAIWDGRFRVLGGGADLQAGAMLEAASGVSQIRTGFAALIGGTFPGVYPEAAGARVVWWPPSPASGAGFVAAADM